MAKKNFLLLSLEDAQAKKVANIVSNDSCRKILDLLAENESTESEIAKKLSLPISTVHYNLQQLIKGGLVQADEYHYSKKGKEILHYKLANKYIIIAPKKESGLAQKLRGIFATLILAAGVGWMLQWTQKSSLFAPLSTSTNQVGAESAAVAAPQAAKAAVADADFNDAVAESEEVVQETAAEALQLRSAPQEVQADVSIPELWQTEPSLFGPLSDMVGLWFFAGAVFVVLLYMVYLLVKKNR